MAGLMPPPPRQLSRCFGTGNFITQSLVKKKKKRLIASVSDNENRFNTDTVVVNLLGYQPLGSGVDL